MASKGQTLTLPQAAALLGRSERFVGNLRERGYVSTVAHGEYPLVGLIRGVIAYFEDIEVKNAHTAREVAATDARTREIELRIQRKCADLMPAADAIAVLDEMAAAVAEEMARVPARTSSDPKKRAELENEVAISLKRMAKLTAAAKTQIQTGEAQ